MARLEEQIGSLYGLNHAVLFGRARAGFCAILEVLGLKDRPVLIPSNICPSVAAALKAAEARIVTAPVSPLTGLTDAPRFLNTMAVESKPGLVMPAHLYGLWSDVSTLNGRGWFVLENDTLFVTATSDSRPARASGDAVLVSFNHVKTIEAGRGGAILTNDRNLAKELEKVSQSWPILSDHDDEIENHLILARRHLRALNQSHLAEPLFNVESALVRRSLPETARDLIAAALKAYPEAIARRQDTLSLWCKALAPYSSHLAPPEAESVLPWRLIRRVVRPSLRDPLIKALRQAGFEAGTNYPALSSSLPSIIPAHPDSDLWEKSVINLWLTQNYDSSRVQAAADLVGAVLEAHAQ